MTVVLDCLSQSRTLVSRRLNFSFGVVFLNYDTPKFSLSDACSAFHFASAGESDLVGLVFCIITAR